MVTLKQVHVLNLLRVFIKFGVGTIEIHTEDDYDLITTYNGNTWGSTIGFDELKQHLELYPTRAIVYDSMNYNDRIANVFNTSMKLVPIAESDASDYYTHEYIIEQDVEWIDENIKVLEQIGDDSFLIVPRAHP